jgi:osmotically-inducible protein OsmY
MADNRRNQSSYASDENWDKNQRRYVDDNNYGQRSNRNPRNMDLDKDGNIGETGGFYGGTNYMGGSPISTNYDQNWENQNQGRPHDRDYEEFQGYGYQSKSDYNHNYQQYGNMNNQQNRGQQNFNRNENRGRQDYNQQYNDYDNRRQWQGDRYNKSSQHREEEHPLYYGHVGGLKSIDDDPFDNQNNQGNVNRDYNRNRNDERSWWDKTRDEVSSWFGGNDDEHRRKEERRTGEHRGKGPKEYRRSDERIREDVCDRLSDDAYIDASDIEVRVSNGEVILDGTIDNRNSKRRAEDIIESIAGVSNVQNNLRVGQSMPASSSGFTGTSIDVSNTQNNSGLSKNR